MGSRRPDVLSRPTAGHGSVRAQGLRGLGPRREASTINRHRVDAPPLEPGVLDGLRQWWVGRPTVSTRTRVVFWVVFVYAAITGVAGSRVHAAAAALWLAAGALAWIAATALDWDVRSRIARHDASALPALSGGWRLAAPLAVLEPGDLLVMDAVGFLYSTVIRTWKAGVGATAAGGRWTYAEGIRATLRAWARSRGLPIRRGDRMGRELVALGLLRCVRINQAIAWQLVHPTAEDAWRAYERTVGRRVIAWELGGPDPRLRAEDASPSLATARTPK